MQNNTQPETLKSLSLLEIENAIAMVIQKMIKCQDVKCDIRKFASVEPSNSDEIEGWAGGTAIENYDISLSIKTTSNTK